MPNQQNDQRDLWQVLWQLFLDFVNASANAANPANPAHANASASAKALMEQTAATLRALDDNALMQFVNSSKVDNRMHAAVCVTAAMTQLLPDRPGVYFAAGLACQLAGNHEAAIPFYRQAGRLNARYPNLRNNLAVALAFDDPMNAESAALLNAEVAENPQSRQAWTNLARLRPTDLDLKRLIHANERALELGPHDPPTLNNYSMMLKERQHWEEATHMAQEACKYSDPSDAVSRFNLSLLQLVQGDFANGWVGHELRWLGARELKSGRPKFQKPEWRNEPIAGRTLLVWGEQGMGDLMQFSRYIPLLAERVHREGGQLVWNSFPQMGNLLVRSFHGHYDLFSVGGPVDRLPPYDIEISLLSLPLLFNTRVETIPGPTGYLSPDPVMAASWRQRLSGERRLKVGLTWTGNLSHQRNPFRRVGLDAFARHFAGLGKDVAFYSLQPGMNADVEAVRKTGFEMADFSAEWKTFDDTAAFVSELDLVISVCTSAAHLVGALGKRAWVLLDVNPHWVWMLNRRDSPWYPNTTLYRQKEFRQWEPVLEEVAADLTALAKEHKAQ